MKKALGLFLGIFFLFVLSERPAFSQGGSESELALFEEIPMVITPAKKLQPITESPASVYVITQEDIKESGSINLWDSLREVPGMDVVTSTVGQADVSMRGFADLMTNKTLLLLDGRSIYIPAQGYLLWESLQAQLEEIDRIEVVKGPVASLYGANANLGLINVITKSPKEMQGLTFSSTGGSEGTARYSLIYGGENQDLAYKISAGWKEENSFNARDKDALDVGKANMLLEYQIDKDSKASLSAGIVNLSTYFLTSATQIANKWYLGPLDQVMSYVKTDYQSGNLDAKAYWNHLRMDKYETAKLYQVAKTVDTIETELRYRFEPKEKHSFMVGGGGRYDYAEANIFGLEDNNTKSQAIWDIFFQDEYKLRDNLTLVGSARVDHYPLSGYNPSGRLSSLYRPQQNHLFRASIGYSFRSPTLSDYYLSLPLNTGAGVQTTRGSKELDPERYLTLETGYQGDYLNRRLKLSLDLFWTKIKDFINAYGTGTGPILQDQSFRNEGYAYSSGGEAGAKYYLADYLTLIGNYAFNNVQYDKMNERYLSPRHKVNLGFKFKLLEDKLTAKLLAHYVSGAIIDDGGKVDSYVMANLWVGYQVNDKVEMSLSGYNILHDKHQEHPAGDEIGTRILGSVKVKF